MSSTPRTVRPRDPASAVAGRSAGTSTSVVDAAPDWVTSTWPARPVALATETSPVLSRLLGQVRIERLSPVSRGGYVDTSTLAGRTRARAPIVRAGSRTARTAVRLRRALSPRAPPPGGGRAARRAPGGPRGLP